MTTPPNKFDAAAAPDDAAPSASETAAASAMAAALDRLAERERSSPMPALEERIFAVSRRALVPLPREVAAVAARADALAAQDQLAAPTELEQTAFELSREAVASGRFTAQEHSAEGLGTSRRVHGAEPLRRGGAWRVWSLRVARIAAVLALAAVAWTVLPRSGQAPPPMVARSLEPTADELAESLASELETALTFMDWEGMDPGADSAANSAASVSELDTSWIDDLFSRESL